MILTTIEASTIPDAWFQCVYELLNKGKEYVVEHGSYVGEKRIEFDYATIYIKHPYSEPYDTMLPTIPDHLGLPNPVECGYVEQYMPYLMTDAVLPGEDYTYGQRIYQQIQYWINILKQTPNTNQAILQVGKPSDRVLIDPPCLRHMDMKIRNGKLEFAVYFRSWDLWGGFPANLAGIAVLQKYMADGIGVESGSIIAASKGLHIYGYAEELAKLRCLKNDAGDSHEN